MTSRTHDLKKLKISTVVLLAMGSLFAGSVRAEVAVPTGDPSKMVFNLAPVTVEAQRPEWESQLSPGTVTVIRPEEFKGEQKTLPDLLKEVPGVHVREVNGKGQYTTVTIRGSTAAQVGVFVDGVMTNLGGDSAVDISTIPVKNVERIEVYRGYIPARFGGTFIGGVINVVTKKPKKVGASAEIGKTSLGGHSVSTEVTAPLGGGSLFLGANYESSDGDFKYRNYAASRTIPGLEREIAASQSYMDNYYLNEFNHAVRDGALQMTQEEMDAARKNPLGYLTSDAAKKNLEDTYVKNNINLADDTALRGNAIDKVYDIIKNDHADVYQSYKDLYATWYPGKEITEDALKSFIKGDWTGYSDGGILNKGQDDPDFGIVADNSHYQKGLLQELQKEYQDLIKTEGPARAAEYLASLNLDPSTNTDLSTEKKKQEILKRKLKYARDNRRHRRYNDYENSSFIAKWQDENWMGKFSWNKVDRHLPDSTWGYSANDAMESFLTHVDDIYYAESRRQKLTNTEGLLENRHQNGRLEWGWRADYLHQNKDYKAEKKLFWTPHVGSTDRNFRWNNIPLREWSRYRSNKYNIQLDGSYKLSDRQMLDFQTNYSHERLNIDGSLMHEVLTGSIGNLLGCMRNRYEQNIFNFQLQDSITLDRSGSLVLTPAVRYNQSEIIGYSDSRRFSADSRTHFHWLHPKDSQTDGKWTWQLALKKIFNDHFTLRTTGGTYYRLLNMYEIAGDGAGILPASRDGSQSVFPRPEEGKQYDFSFLFNGKILGADNDTTITYFWRDSTNMLQLFRAGLDYWSYFNDNRGKAHGWELQSRFKWSKFDLELKGTQTLMHVQRKNSTVHYGYSDVHATYQPEWETNVRLTYHPNQKWSVFGEMHHTGSYFTYYGRDIRGGEADYLTGKPVSALTVYNGGIKWQPKKSLQVTVGCNDIFNEGPKQKVKSYTYGYDAGYISADYPLQGRTYYATVRYVF